MVWAIGCVDSMNLKKSIEVGYERLLVFEYNCYFRLRYLGIPSTTD